MAMTNKAAPEKHQTSMHTSAREHVSKALHHTGQALKAAASKAGEHVVHAAHAAGDKAKEGAKEVGNAAGHVAVRTGRELGVAAKKMGRTLNPFDDPNRDMKRRMQGHGRGDD